MYSCKKSKTKLTTNKTFSKKKLKKIQRYIKLSKKKKNLNSDEIRQTGLISESINSEIGNKSNNRLKYSKIRNLFWKISSHANDSCDEIVIDGSGTTIGFQSF